MQTPNKTAHTQQHEEAAPPVVKDTPPRGQDRIGLAKTFLSPLIAAIFLIILSAINFLSFHTIAELFSIIVAVAMFFIAWNTFAFSRDHFLMFLASGYFWIASIDLIHTLTYPGINIFEYTGTNTAVQFWIVARYFEAALLLAAPLFFKREVRAGFLFLMFGAVTAIAFTMIMEEMAPILYVEGVGLMPLKVYSEYVIIGILGLALIHLALKRNHLGPNIFFALVTSIVLTMGAELAFTFYVSAFDLSNIIGHIFKFTSYWIILGVIIRTTLTGPYIRLKNENKERKEAQEELDRFFTLSFDMQCIAGADGYFKRLNQAWVDNLGYSIDELKSRPFVDFVHPDDLDKTIKATEKLAQGNVVVEFENRYRKKDGSYIWIVWNAIVDTDKGLIYANAHNITRRKQYEQDLEDTVQERTLEVRTSEERLRLILDNVVDSIVTADAKGQIISCNPGTEKIFGYSQDEMVGQGLGMLMPDSEAQVHGAHMDAYLDTGVPKIIGKGRELDGKHKDGRLVPIDIAVSQLRINDELIFIGIIRDITDRKMAEEALQRAKEAADGANRAKSDFLASMSHELRTPLNAIIGFSDTMQQEIFGPIGNDKYKEYLNDINYSGNHLLALINDILDVSAIEAQALDLNEENVRLDVAVDAAMRLITPRAKEGKVNVTSSVTGECPQIFADERRVKQIFLNLLSNAVKFTPEGGDVKVDSRLNDDASISISVTDTGIGMNEDEVKQAMSKFGQVDTGLGRKHEGTGLGLPLTVGLIEHHGGTFTVKSASGKGTEMTVNFPAERVIPVS